MCVTVTVFSTGPGCHLCLVTRRHLTTREIRFDEIRLDENPEWAERIKTLGFTKAPVVLVDDDDVWDGYSGESIDQLAKELAYVAA